MFLLIGYLVRVWKRRKAANSNSAVAEHHGS